MLSRFTVTICVSVAVVGDKGGFCPGGLAISGIIFFAFISAFEAQLS